MKLIKRDLQCTRESQDMEANGRHGGAMWVLHTDGNKYSGQATVKGVEFRHMGKMEQEHAALTFARIGEDASRDQIPAPSQLIEQCIFRDGERPGVQVVYAGNDFSLRD